MGYDILIRGGTLVSARGEWRGDVGIRGERIVEVGLDLDPTGANQIISAEGALVIPGGIDPHVHFSLPVAGTRSADDFETGSIGAALGGTTCYLDFVTPARSQSLLEAYRARQAEATGRTAVDYGLHMSITGWFDGIEEEIDSMVAAGLPTFKAYLAYKDTIGVDDGVLYRALKRVGAAGGLVLVHAINGDVYAALVSELAAAGTLEPRHHPLGQPAIIEGEATSRAISLAELVGQGVYVVHVTCAESLAAVERARGAGVPVRAETCIQYLLLDDSLYDAPPGQASRYVLSPPLRSHADQAALWAALERGGLDAVATDHCPFPIEGGKDRGCEDFRLIPNGLPGIEERLVLLHSAGVVTGRLSRSRWVQLTSTGPARIMGLYPRKGRIAPGSDADLVVFDPGATQTLSIGDHPRAYDYLPYEGMEVVGAVSHVLVRGQEVVRQGEYRGDPSWGRFIHRRLPALRVP